MEKKDIKKLGVSFAVILLMAIGFDLSKGNLSEDGTIVRGEIGEDEKAVNLILDIDGRTEGYEYLLYVEAMRPTKEQAAEYFSGAILEIEKDFANIQEVVPMEGEYQDGIVEAEWNLDPWNAVNADGTIVHEKIPEEELIVNADVTLYCGEYEQIYQFPFEITKKAATEEEEILGALKNWMDTEMAREGEEKIFLPTELEGVSLYWSEKRESLTLSILVLEMAAVVLILAAQWQKKEREKKELLRKLELDYPDVVGQLTLLLGAGMNIRQAWNKIATRYSDKRKKNQIEKKPAFEEIVRMNRRIQEGENEKIAYQQFANETQNMCYHRLIRLLVGNLEKGTKGICEILEQESKQAYEQRIMQAKKLGEEASTRMLMPLMLMMVVVMAIVMMPAMISFIG